MRTDTRDIRRVRRAAVVDESVLQRTRAVQLLTDDLGLDVVHTNATLGSFVTWLERTDRTGWPHLLVVDLSHHSESPRDLAVISALRDAGIRVLVLSALRSRSLARQLLEIGIDAIVAAADSEEDFVIAAETVLSGGSAISARAKTAIYGSGDAPRLSRQEERALALYASGLTIVEVADRIGVRHDTARKYLRRVRDKLTVAGRPARSKLDLARIAWVEGYTISHTDAVQRRSRTEGVA